MTSIHSWN